MMNFNEMSLNEIKELVFELFSEEKAREILSLSPDEIISILESEEEMIIDADSSDEIKHSSSRKKKCNRSKNHKAKERYKKEKQGDWAEHSRKRIKEPETTNRSFINKSSKSYIPNRTQKH